MRQIQWIYAVLCAINLVAFIVAGWDKLQAKRHGRRVRERTLVLLSACCGGIGELLAFYFFHHKTRHTRLMSAVWFFTIAEGAVLLWFFLSV